MEKVEENETKRNETMMLVLFCEVKYSLHVFLKNIIYKYITFHNLSTAGSVILHRKSVN